MVTQLVAYLFGVATGAGGTYFGNKYTDQRRRQEARKEQRAQFKKIYDQMPKLIDEIRADLESPDSGLVREFFVISKKWVINFTGKIFRYYFEDHEDLESKIQILENHGFIWDVSPNNTKRYRMSEEFVELVKTSTI